MDNFETGDSVIITEGEFCGRTGYIIGTGITRCTICLDKKKGIKAVVRHFGYGEFKKKEA